MTIQNNPKHDSSDNTSPAFDQAVVIGSGLAGLTAARVLADHCAEVKIVERDLLMDTPDFRHGIPQAHHAHTLLPRGRAIFERLFPGLMMEITSLGAVPVDMARESALFLSGQWRTLGQGPDQLTIACSRPLLETTICRRLATYSNIDFVDEHEVLDLSTSEDSRYVSGLCLVHRHDPYATEIVLPANLVADASGRGSHTPWWLEDIGYTAPQETIINAFAGYSSLIVRPPTDFTADWKALYVRPSRRTGPRGGIILPLEGGRWHVTLIGMAHDHPPTDLDGFSAFARSLPTTRLYKAIKDAEPLTHIHGYLNTANRLRHYDKLPTHLEGFLVTGDAVHIMNPVYALGMTVAAEDSLVLSETLKLHLSQHHAGEVAGLANAFQKALRRTLSTSWRLATNEDSRWPETEIQEDIPPSQHVIPNPGLKRNNKGPSSEV